LADRYGYLWVWDLRLESVVFKEQLTVGLYKLNSVDPIACTITHFLPKIAKKMPKNCQKNNTTSKRLVSTLQTEM
jgi:hypothetical protein